MKRKIIILSFLLCILPSLAFANGQIVPGKSMGEIVLGKTLCQESQKQSYNFSVMIGCNGKYVFAAQTNTGGSIWVEGHKGPNRIIQVGINSAKDVIDEFGSLFESRFSKQSNSIVWLIYKKTGIAFRVIYANTGEITVSDSRSIIQSILVFLPSDK